MVLKQYSVTLTRLKQNDIELVRYWRNAPSIRNNMEYRDFITPEMQQAWFKRVNTPKYLNFIIHSNNKKIGLITGQDFETHSEGGMFIWDIAFTEAPEPVMASLMLSDMQFILRNENNTFIKILKENKSIIAYNKQLGFKLCDGQEHEANQLYCLTNEDYTKNSAKIKKLMSSYYGGFQKIKIIFEEEDYTNGIIDKYKPHIIKPGFRDDYFDVVF